MSEDQTYYQRDGKPLHACLQQDKLLEIAKFMGGIEEAVENTKNDVGVLFKEMRGIKTAVENLAIDINTVKVKFGIYGALIGSAAAISVNVVFLLMK